MFPCSIRALAAAYGIGEIVVLTICYDFEERKRSHKLPAEVWIELTSNTFISAAEPAPGTSEGALRSRRDDGFF